MGLLRFSYRSEILSLHTNITVTLPSEELTYYPLTDIKREEGVAARRKWEYRDGMKFQTVYLLHGGGDDDAAHALGDVLALVLSGNQILSVMRKKTV